MSRPMRILLLNERCHANPRAGGAEIHLAEIFSRLAGPDVDVELLCSGFPGSSSRDDHRGISIRRLGGRFTYYTHVTRAVRRRLREGRVDVIVEALNKLPFLTPLYADVPVLAIHHHLHGLTAFRQVSPPLAAVSLALEQLVPLVYRRVPFVTISHSSKLELVRRGLPEEAVDVVPCGIDHEVHRPAIPTGRAPHLVALGRVEPYKRLGLIIRSMPRVVAAVPDVELSIVGRGQDVPKLQQLARSLGVASHVAFRGFVGDEEKVSLLQSAALSVQCSRKEGWGLTVVEAYACGTPVVAMDVPGLRDSVQDGITGLLVQNARPAPLAAAIVKLLRDEPKRVQMARFAQRFAERFCWDAAARDVHRALGHLVPRRHLAPGALSPTPVPASVP